MLQFIARPQQIFYVFTLPCRPLWRADKMAVLRQDSPDTCLVTMRAQPLYSLHAAVQHGSSSSHFPWRIGLCCLSLTKVHLSGMIHFVSW